MIYCSLHFLRIFSGVGCLIIFFGLMYFSGSISIKWDNSYSSKEIIAFGFCFCKTFYISDNWNKVNQKANSLELFCL